MPEWARATCVSGFGRCTYGELCNADHGCAQPDVCTGGVCVSPNAKLGVHCGAVRCGTDKPVCCDADEPTCMVSEEACGQAGHHKLDYRCARPDDCSTLQICYEFFHRTACFGSYPNGGLAMLCDKDSDCDWQYSGAPIVPDEPAVKMRCVPHEERSWLRVCEPVQ